MSSLAHGTQLSKWAHAETVVVSDHRKRDNQSCLLLSSHDQSNTTLLSSFVYTFLTESHSRLFTTTKIPKNEVFHHQCRCSGFGLSCSISRYHELASMRCKEASILSKSVNED